MASKDSQYQFTLNKLLLIGMVVLLAGVGIGYGIFYLRGQSLKSDATYGCESERNDVYIYSNRLIEILQDGGQITQRQLVTLEDLIDIWSECALFDRPFASL